MKKEVEVVAAPLWRVPVVAPEGPFRAAYSPRVRQLQDFSEEVHGSNVKQSFKDEVDVNNIVTRFERTGVLPGGESAPPQYLDVSELPSYHEALNQVRAVDAFFATLDAETREAFGNDPGRFLEFVSDPANQAEAEAYGVSVADRADGGAAVAAAEASQEGSVEGSSASSEVSG